MVYRRFTNYLPEIDEIATASGPGEAVIDFEVLFGRYGGKKKCSKRTVIRIAETFCRK